MTTVSAQVKNDVAKMCAACIIIGCFNILIGSMPEVLRLIGPMPEVVRWVMAGLGIMTGVPTVWWVHEKPGNLEYRVILSGSVVTTMFVLYELPVRHLTGH